MKAFITAFNRDRDSYQVPLALYEGGMLEALVTDLYVPNALRQSSLVKRLALSHRFAPGLPSKKVKMSWQTIKRQLIDLRLCRTQLDRIKVFSALDQGLSRQSLQLAVATGASLFTYSGYALEAFSDLRMADRRRILFVYHPPDSGSFELLRRDFAKYPEMKWSYELHKAESCNTDGARFAAEINLATEIVCASSFTKKMVQKINSEVPITVVPYGCSEPTNSKKPKPSQMGGKPRVLFVGQGVQRKGLHHLLKAWARRDSDDAELTLVCSKLDPAIKEMLKTFRHPVNLLSNISREELAGQFEVADIFVMPSLVEGFGLVYLEALSAGCFCIGTENTGLPDLHLPREVACTVPCGEIEDLAMSLNYAIGLAKRNKIDVESIRHEAGKHSWSNFREKIRSIALRHT